MRNVLTQHLLPLREWLFVVSMDAVVSEALEDAQARIHPRGIAMCHKLGIARVFGRR
jgi:hypothetical protein